MYQKKIKLSLFVVLFIITVQRSFSQEFYLGADLSYVNELQDSGVKYFSADAVETDPYELLANKGANMVRLRLWHNPDWTNYSNLSDVRKSIARAKANGQAVLLDFHYSDFWADPSRQWSPAAWNDITDNAVMGDSVFNYTYAVLKTLANEGLLPEMVQIGNETNGNILIKRNNEDIDDKSPGMFPINWSRQVSLFHKGIEAVQQINTELSTQIKTVIHVAQPENAIWWFDDAVKNGLSGFDIIGLSYYPQWSDLDVRDVGEHIKFLKETYGKEVMVVETGYPWTLNGKDNAGNVLGNASKRPTYGNIISNGVQRDILIELTYLIKENGGLGIIYWEPAWVSSTCKTYWGTGSHYENSTLFDFDNKLNSGADFLAYDYTQIPNGLANKDVTFRVNMSGNETQNGVFVTGSFTGETWTLEEMSETSGNVFELTLPVPGRSIGGYIYYNNNSWESQYKETVPSSCAKMWNTHRQYIITDQPVEYSYSWGRCDFETANNSEKQVDFTIYPSPSSDFLNVQTSAIVKSIKILNAQGQLVTSVYANSKLIEVQHLKAGIYFLRVETTNETQSYKFIKQ